jgi:hypothetical protein
MKITPKPSLLPLDCFDLDASFLSEIGEAKSLRIAAPQNAMTIAADA